MANVLHDFAPGATITPPRIRSTLPPCEHTRRRRLGFIQRSSRASATACSAWLKLNRGLA
jgi:hypothetical protein